MSNILTPEQFKQKYGIGIPVYTTSQKPVGRTSPSQSRFQETSQDVKQTFSNVGRRFTEAADEVSEIKKRAGQQDPRSTAIQVLGQGFGAASQAFGDIFIGLVKGALNQKQEDAVKEVVKRTTTKVMENPTVSQTVKTGVEQYQKLPIEQQKNIEGLFNIGMLFMDGLGLKGAGVGVKGLGRGIKQTGQIVKTTADEAIDVVSAIKRNMPELGDKAKQLLASEPSDQVRTILQNAPTTKFDEFVEIARKSSKDLKATTGFELVGDRLGEATKQIQSQLNSLGSQKAKIIAQAKVGLETFKDAPRRAILEVNRLADSPIKKEIIAKLKSIKTKADADRVIDEIQDIIFNASGTQLIAKGSAIERQLRGIIGKMNSELKNTLPKAYRTLNDKYADRINILQKLNKSLGDTLDGVPLRGASLVKQFFSPSGRTAKELFEFVKKNTGIDLAEDTVLAKFTAELFNDPKVRSLLQGIPKGKTGIIDRGLELLAEKSGLAKKAQEAIRKGTIKKARDITKP